MNLRFTKMHGLGNDYIYINGCSSPEKEMLQTLDMPEFARAVSRPHFGVGADGVILILPSAQADFRMQMFNADGSEGEMCGNGIRCVGKYVYDSGLAAKDHLPLRVETRAGIKRLRPFFDARGKVEAVQADMGAPLLGEQIRLTLRDGRAFDGTPVSMGNPHVVIFVDDAAHFPVADVGAEIEVMPQFPQRTNVEFVQVIAPDRLKMRVWERGSGETQACGTGACASLCAAAAMGKSAFQATLELLGGNLAVSWDQAQNTVLMTGPAVEVFRGTLFLLHPKKK